MLKDVKKGQKRTIFPNLTSEIASICVFLCNFAAKLMLNGKW